MRQAVIRGLLGVALAAGLAAGGCGGGPGAAVPAAPATVPGTVTRPDDAPRREAAAAAIVRPQQSHTGLLGDLMGTGRPEVGSAVKILREIVGLDPAPAADQMWQWDCNSSGAIDVGDAVQVLRCVVSLDAWPIGSSPATLTNLFFLHHSTGDNLIVQGDVRGEITRYNQAHGTAFVFWDHGYNGDGLRDPSGEFTGTNYSIPDDNTNPDGLFNLWCGTDSASVTCRNTILGNHQVIAFKSCFPAAQIEDDGMLAQYKTWYLGMRSFFDTRADKRFVVMSPPPLHRLANNPAWARRARDFATWLGSGAYLSGHPNIRYFNLFDQFARADDGSATANMLRYEYEGSHSSDDSHPNVVANQTVGPVFARFLCEVGQGG